MHAMSTKYVESEARVICRYLVLIEGIADPLQSPLPKFLALLYLLTLYRTSFGAMTVGLLYVPAAQCQIRSISRVVHTPYSPHMEFVIY